MELRSYIKDILGDAYVPGRKYVATKPSGFQRRLRQGFLPVEEVKEAVMFNSETFILMYKGESDETATPAK